MAIITTPLDYPKIDKIPVPASEDPAQYITATDWNTLCTVTDSIRANGGGGANFTGIMVIANTFSGSDIGAQINAAMASIASTGGVVRVLDGNYTISTQIIVEANCALVLGSGLFDNTIVGGPIILMKDNTAVVGQPNWTSVVKEPENSADIYHANCIAIGDYILFTASPNDKGNSNLLVRDVSFAHRATYATGISGTVNFGNCQNIRVEHCYFNSTSGFGMVAGGASDIDPPNCCDGVFFVDNTLLNVATQPIAAVNARNVFVHRNLIRSGAAASGPTYIDLEINDGLDSMNSFSIIGNTIDCAGATTSAGYGIQVAGNNRAIHPGYLGGGIYGVVSNNVINGGDPTGGKISAGIGLSFIEHCLITGNTISYSVQSMIQLSNCNDIMVTNNRLCSGAGSGGSIPLFNSTYCKISGNTISNAGDTDTDWPQIIEYNIAAGTSDYNLIVGNHLYYHAGDNPGESSLQPQIILVGNHSREFGNFIDGLPTGDYTIESPTELRALPTPGTRNTAHPASTNVNGVRYIYDPTSTLTDNGITVVKPTLTPGAGRWIRNSPVQHYTTTDRTALSLTSADAGFLVYDTTVPGYYFWDGGAWTAIGTGGGGGGGETGSYVSSSTDGPSAVAKVLDTSTSWTQGKELSVRSGGTEGLSISLNTIVAGSAVVQAPNTTYLGFFDSNFNGFKIQSGSTYIRSGASDNVVFATGVMSPAADSGSQCGTSSNRWAASWSYSFAGVHQNVSGSGAVSINTQLGEMCVLTATANVTGITLAAGKPAQVFTLQLDQGGSVYTWPTTITNARLAGGTFTKTAGINTVDTITFRYNATHSTWDEISRTLALS